MAVSYTDVIPMLVVGVLLVHGAWKAVAWLRDHWPERDESG